MPKRRRIVVHRKIIRHIHRKAKYSYLHLGIFLGAALAVVLLVAIFSVNSVGIITPPPTSTPTPTPFPTATPTPGGGGGGGGGGGTPTPTPQPVSSNVKKAGIAMVSGSLPDSDIQFVASHFNMIVTNTDWQSSAALIAALKAANPSLKILAYKDMMASSSKMQDQWAYLQNQESWYVHDALGNRLYYSPFQWYMLDPANSNWRAYFVNYLNSLPSGYDGVWVDDTWNQVTTYFGVGTGTNQISSAKAASWHNDVLGFVQYLKGNYGKLVIVNSDEWATSSYINVADGQVFEGFAHTEWDAASSNGGRDATFNIQLIDRLSVDSARGKYIWCDSGTMQGTSAENTRVLTYCYAAYLLGLNGPNAYFSFNSWYNSDGAKAYYPIMDTNVGNPLGAYTRNGNVLTRQFEEVTVTVNMDTQTATIQSK